MQLRERWNGAKGDVGFYLALAVLVALLGSGAFVLRREEAGSAPAYPAVESMAVPEEAVMPVENGVVLREYGPEYNERLGLWEMRETVEIAAEAGAQVRAVRAGRVGRWEDEVYGKGVEVVHGDGLVSRYAPVRSALEEAEVIAGEAIGTLEADTLYFVLLRDGKPVDPESN